MILPILHDAAPVLVDAASHLGGLVAAGKNDPTWLDNPALTKQFLPAIGQTLLMMGFSTAFSVLLGLPLGLVLVQTGKTGLTPNRPVYETISFIVNIIRSLPFIIGIIMLIPITRLIVGSSLGWQATVVPLVILSVPFFARLVESNILAVDAGKIEAAQMMGASNRQIRWGVQVREAMPMLVQSTTTLAITLIGYSAMAGAVGGGGLGQMAINYGYNRWQDDVMISTVIAIVVIVQVVQMIGDVIARAVDHR
ncbi:ABC transporter permease subunit [Actinomyces sp. B33]|uniref:methionine ABC transporter permease n=1 Tax=Actinomyces sp. B33 TaxID=2942131 RepID=UPI0023404B82|nr:ABC transporter permease subunit [Actinomyces sp. B33]MDC4233937.1 ABC transporter permease subunit [Actinomyces sp. B33]